jgi:hypothetical protein
MDIYLPIAGQGHCRTGAGKRLSSEPLPPVEVDLHIAADAHRYARSRVDPVNTGLRPAPDPDAGRKLLVHRPGQREPAVDEFFAPVDADDAGLQISIEKQVERHRPVI